LIQALHDLRNGQLHRCLEMGFGVRELEMLKQPEMVALLVNARVLWCTVKVNREVLQRLAGQAHDVEWEIRTVDRMLRLGASTEMVSRHHGLTHQEIALRRRFIDLPGRKGRHPMLDEEQEAKLWRAWKTAMAERGIAPDDEAAMLELAMDLFGRVDSLVAGSGLGDAPELDRAGACRKMSGTPPVGIPPDFSTTHCAVAVTSLCHPVTWMTVSHSTGF
jgi:hypothetical protein